MKQVSRLVGLVLVLNCWSWIGIATTAAREAPVAIVAMLSGKAVARFDRQRSELRLFQRLRPGTSVETEAGSSLVLAFFTGDRYQLGERTSAVVQPASLDRKKGMIQQLAPVPVMIDIAPIAREERPNTRLAGTRIRTGATTGRALTNLYPSRGAATVRGALFVQFDPVPGYQRYKVDVEDESGTPVFSVESASTAVQIGRDVLRPSTRYYWRVRTLDTGKPVLQAEAVFSTLSEDEVRRRDALRAHIDRTGDRSLLGLLAELDRSVGLHREACDGLRAALAETPGNQPIAEALTLFECSRQ